MPKTTKSGKARKSELPSTLKKSDARRSGRSPRRTMPRRSSTARANARTGLPTTR